MNQDCKLLDGYLDLDLSPGDSALFEQHLTICQACRTAVDEQAWIDALMCKAADLEALPAGLANVEVIPPSHSRVWWKAGAAAAAAVLLVGMFAWLSNPVDSSNERAEPSAIVASRESIGPTVIEIPPPDFTPVARMVPEDDVIVIPVDSGSPEVTILQVYPTASARSRWRREALLNDRSYAQNGG